MIELYLEDLEDRIDPDVENVLLGEWQGFWDGDPNGGYFCPCRPKASVSSIEWPHVSCNEALESFKAMALQQLAICSAYLAEGSGAPLAVRANYGTAIMPSLFGAEIFLMPPELDTLPTTRPLAGGSDVIERLVQNGIPDLGAGYGEQTFTMGHHFVDLLSEYPKVSKYVHIYHPDLQGPMDICEMLWGSSLFVDIVDRPDLVKSLLELITETYIQFMHKWNYIAPPGDGLAVHWGLMHKGTIMLRDDSAMNFSPEMFAEFIQPYDQHLLDEFGGGCIHFCGKGDHYIHRLAQMIGVHAVALSQPHCNDMETIFKHTIDKGIKLIGLAREAAESAIKQGRCLHGNVHC